MAEKQEKPKTVEEMTLTELQALAYQQIIELQRVQNNLNILQAEIAKKENGK